MTARELLTRRDEDQRVRHLVAFKGRRVAVLPDDVHAQLQRVDEFAAASGDLQRD
jgi:hypothetical protein